VCFRLEVDCPLVHPDKSWPVALLSEALVPSSPGCASWADGHLRGFKRGGSDLPQQPMAGAYDLN